MTSGASEKMTWVIYEVFNRIGSRNIKKAIEKESDWGGGFSEEDLGLLRTKLRYLPVIMWTAMTGCFGYSAKAILERRNLKHPIFAESFYKPIREGEDWQREDEETYNWLIARIPVNLKIVKCIHGNGHIAWPMQVFGIKEVMDEINFLMTKPFLSMNDEYDKQIEEKFGKLIGAVMYKEGKIVNIEGTKSINMAAEYVGKILNHNINVYKKYNIDFWFTIYYS